MSNQRSCAIFSRARKIQTVDTAWAYPATLAATNSRARHYYGCASAEVDRTPELVKIGFQPWRMAKSIPAAVPAKSSTPAV